MRRTQSNSSKDSARQSRIPTSSQLRRGNRARPVSATRIRGSRARGEVNVRLPYAPPEDWHEPREQHTSYRFVMQEPGKGYRFAVTPDEVRERLAQLPVEFVRPLQVIQFSRMTRKKASAPCYGMQWGSTIYLYPIEEDFVERYDNPPRPALLTEARMYGGRWEHSRGEWRLIWTPEAIRDFFLNNILIHELGHVLDNRNSRAIDRERYAEWFAIHYGYRPSRVRR